MATVQFKSEISIELDQLLTGVAQLDTPDLEKLLVQVRQVLAHRQNPSLPALELELLQKINQALPEGVFCINPRKRGLCKIRFSITRLKTLSVNKKLSQKLYFWRRIHIMSLSMSQNTIL